MVALVVAFAALTPASGHAEERGPAYRLSIEVDLPLLLIGVPLASGYFLMNETGPAACAPLCDRARLNALDRPFAGLNSANWGTVGDIATASTILIVPLAVLVGEGAGNGFHDLLVVAEAALATSALQVPISYAVARPRPRLYSESVPLSERNDANGARSFFSGHVANCVAATVATSDTLWRLHRSGLAWTALVVGLAGSTLVGVARVGAGSHFPTDVLVGASVGVGVGIAVPALHAAKLQIAPIANHDGSGLVVAGHF